MYSACLGQQKSTTFNLSDTVQSTPSAASISLAALAPPINYSNKTFLLQWFQRVM
jgi:hypothetical protein